MRWKVRRQRGGPEEQGVGLEEASLQRLSGGPPCRPPLCHPVAEQQLASMWWLASGGLLEGHWCYVCRVTSIGYLACRAWVEGRW